jgi:hypothetical protein
MGASLLGRIFSSSSQQVQYEDEIEITASSGRILHHVSINSKDRIVEVSLPHGPHLLSLDSYPTSKALLLGAGFVTKPTVEILAKDGVEVTVG